MMWQTRATIGELCTVVAGGTPARSNPKNFGGTIPWIKIGDMLQGCITHTEECITELGIKNSSAKVLPVGTVIVSIFATIGRTAVLGVEAATNQAIAGLTPRNPDQLSAAYLRRYLDSVVRELETKAQGVAQVNINSSILKALKIPLLPISEQRRILGILDSVDALRAKRRKAIALLGDLAQSIFLEMFGDPTLNPRGWQRRRFGSLLEVPLRNGLSPSASGKVYAKVLTLSAITGSYFDPSAFKVAPFNSRPPEAQAVRATDFLICRGNGNANLVGRGVFPPCDMLDTTFPDTVISARPSPLQVAPDYLRHVWESSEVRRQIKSAARTTNGTFKINQTMLELIEVPVPPLELQLSFVDRIRRISNLQSLQQNHLTELDALFASFQHHAFRGEMGDAPAA